MKMFKAARGKKKLSLEVVSQAAGLSKSSLWEIEQGTWLPEPEQAAKLRVTLERPGLPDSSQVITQRQIRQMCRPRPFELPANNPIPWQRMEHVFSRQLLGLRVPKTTLEWMKECLASDSPVECLLHCALADDGAREIFASPHALGYRDQCILDSAGRALGERYLPGLLWKIDDVPCLLWPQVNVLTPKGSFRLDLLVMICQKWENIELNGGTHRPEHDRYRASVLGTPIVIDNEAVRNLTFLEPLKAELRKRIKKRGTQACA